MTLTDLTTAITQLGDPELWRYSDTEIGELVPTLNAAIHALEAVRISVVREFTARGKATSDGQTIAPLQHLPSPIDLIENKVLRVGNLIVKLVYAAFQVTQPNRRLGQSCRNEAALRSASGLLT